MDRVVWLRNTTCSVSWRMSLWDFERFLGVRVRIKHLSLMSYLPYIYAIWNLYEIIFVQGFLLSIEGTIISSNHSMHPTPIIFTYHTLFPDDWHLNFTSLMSCGILAMSSLHRVFCSVLKVKLSVSNHFIHPTLNSFNLPHTFSRWLTSDLHTTDAMWNLSKVLFAQGFLLSIEGTILWVSAICRCRYVIKCLSIVLKRLASFIKIEFLRLQTQTKSWIVCFHSYFSNFAKMVHKTIYIALTQGILSSNPYHNYFHLPRPFPRWLTSYLPRHWCRLES